MAYAALDDVKAHLRVSFDSDDSYIESLIDAAEDYVQTIGVGFDSPPQPAILHAVNLLVGHWYSNREAAATEPPREIAWGVSTLLAPYREISL